MARPNKSSSAPKGAATPHDVGPTLRQAEQSKPLPESELLQSKDLNDADSGRLLTDEIVALYVGPKRKVYHVHKALLRDRSSYFRAVFRDDAPFQEGVENEVYFPDDSPEAFAKLIEWLYGGKMSIVGFCTDLNLYIQLFALGEKLCLEKLRNDTMDTVKQYHSQPGIPLTRHFVTQAYRSTSSGSTLRKFCIDMLSFTLTSGKVEIDVLQSFADALGNNGDLARDYVLAHHEFLTYRRRNPDHQTNCFYHRHTETITCD